ncbi:MAG: NADH-quinone oxidoreductase subunit L [Rickettsiaceae bacterium]|nr:NADH-quinone oxidoreductase subunit L [Rickettsiaceae bacterium]
MIELIIALPLFAGIIVGLLSKTISKNQSVIIASSGVILSALISSYVFYKVAYNNEIIHITLWTWLKAGNLSANWAIYIDKLTAIMLIVITFVSSAVHIYSAGYMRDDENTQRFMSYISVFTASMLILVVSDNFLQLFLGWEGVGVCSYLLIGFWHKKDSANNAAVKAFVVNRVGDLALITAIIIIYDNFYSVEFSKIFASVSQLESHQIKFFSFSTNMIELVSFFLFIGCMGKSAQIGLHVWLPDAMEGPTPVSGLIHAATMVTAGVFLLARCSYIFEFAPITRDFIVVTGSLTCLMAALIAIAQTDIKKIIAYSTCSQLGYMFIACGLSQYQLGIFHLFTHAFFKAMLFLGAGSVILAMHHEQDIYKMGGLKKYMKLTYAFFWIGSLAIMGVYPFAGYFSKDFILVAAYEAGSISYICGMIAALCTSIYSMKIIFLVFEGKSHTPHTRKHDHHHSSPSEAPMVMNVPMIFLALGSVFVGIFGQYCLKLPISEPAFFEKAIYLHNHKHNHAHPSLIIELAPMIMALLGAVAGYFAYGVPHKSTKNKNSIFMFLYCITKNKFYFDEIYDSAIVGTSDYLAKIMKSFDKIVIDFAGPGLAIYISSIFANQVANLHKGTVNSYASAFALSLILSLLLIVYRFAL